MELTLEGQNKFDYLNSDKDEYGELLGMRDRGDDKTIHWVQNVAYDKRKEWGLTFGNYYPFRESDFLDISLVLVTRI